MYVNTCHPVKKWISWAALIYAEVYLQCLHLALNTRVAIAILAQLLKEHA